MIGRTIPIGRLAGIPIGISGLWLVIVALITWTLGASYFPDRVEGLAPGWAYLLGLLSALLLFASILLHELGHALVARRRGVPVEGIDLWLLGGVAKLGGPPKRAEDELRYALAGPAVTAVIVVLFAIVVAVVPADSPDTLRAVLEYQLFVNGLILGFNLLPAFPLDGGRVVRALIWRQIGDMRRATTTAARVGRAFAVGFIGLGLILTAAGAAGGLWLAVVGAFLYLAGRAEESQQWQRAALGGHEARELMAFPAVTIPATTTAEEAARSFFARYRFRGFPVVDAGRVLGLVTIERVEALPAESRQTIRVSELVDDDPDLFVDEHADIAELLERPAFRRVGRAVVRTANGKVGILSLTEVERALRALRLIGDGGSAAGSRRGAVVGGPPAP